MRALVGVLARAAGLAVLAAGCAYRTGLSLPPDRETIGVELFGNDSPERDIERELHALLVRKTRELVDATVVSPGSADLVMRGKVLDYRRRSGIRSSENVQLETGLSVRVQASLWDRRTGRNVAGPVTASTQIGYTLERPSASEREARDRVLENLAERLVLDLVSRVEGGRGPEEDR